MAKRKKVKKTPVVPPFEESNILDIFDEEFRCGFWETRSLEEIETPELRVLLEMRQDDIADAEMIIEDQLEEIKRKKRFGEKFDTSFIKSTRQQRQQILCECRLIEAELKRRKKVAFEASIAKLDKRDYINAKELKVA